MRSPPKLDSLRIDARDSADLQGFVEALVRSDLPANLTSLTLDGLSLSDVEHLVDAAGAFAKLQRLVIGTRAHASDLLDRFRLRGVDVVARRSLGPFDPWDEPTDLDPD
jgi:hypothetical protein